MIATGETHSVRELCEIAFSEVDLDYREFVKVDERYYRPAEVDLLIGDASKAQRVLGWQPTYTFKELIREMVKSDLEAIASETGRCDSRSNRCRGRPSVATHLHFSYAGGHGGSPLQSLYESLNSHACCNSRRSCIQAIPDL